MADRDKARKEDVILFETVGTNLPDTITAVRGDAEAAFKNAPYTRREHFRVQRHAAVPMEPRGLLAEWDAEKGRITVKGVCKVPFTNRRALAQMMRLPEQSVRMVEYDVGGGFGARGEFYPEDFLIPFAARLLCRPIKWTEDRRENLTALNHARDMECELEIACERDGTILALRCQAFTDIGAYVRTNGATAARNISQVMSGPYRIPHVRVDVTLVVTNKTPSGTYRGPGRFESDFCRERLFDMVAADLGIDRVEFRRRNLIREADMPYPLADRAGARHRDRMRQRRLPKNARPLPRRIQVGRAREAKRQARRRALSRHRRRLLSRRRRHRAAGECAAGHRGRRIDIALRRLVVGRPGRRDGVCADRRRRAGNADGAHQPGAARLDRLRRPRATARFHRAPS